MIDTLLYLTPSPVFAQTKHLESKEHPIYCHREDNWIWYVKSAKGFPWDSLYYDDQNVYQCHTEGAQGWHDSSSYKLFDSQSYPTSEGGIAWSPRYIPDDSNHGPQDRGIPNFVISGDTTYDEYLAGQCIATRTLGGPAICQVSGPWRVETGKLGACRCLVQTYIWGMMAEHMEVNHYALGFGWVRWQLRQQKEGRYILMQETLFDREVDGKLEKIVKPGASG
jgi:hypothetical protein